MLVLADELPEMYQFPPLDLETPLVPLRPHDFIIFAAALQSLSVSAVEFETFKEEIITEPVAHRAKQDARYR